MSVPPLVHLASQVAGRHISGNFFVDFHLKFLEEYPTDHIPAELLGLISHSCTPTELFDAVYRRACRMDDEIWCEEGWEKHHGVALKALLDPDTLQERVWPVALADIQEEVDNGVCTNSAKHYSQLATLLKHIRSYYLFMNAASTEATAPSASQTGGGEEDEDEDEGVTVDRVVAVWHSSPATPLPATTPSTFASADSVTSSPLKERKKAAQKRIVSLLEGVRADNETLKQENEELRNMLDETMDRCQQLDLLVSLAVEKGFLMREALEEIRARKTQTEKPLVMNTSATDSDLNVSISPDLQRPVPATSLKSDSVSDAPPQSSTPTLTYSVSPASRQENVGIDLRNEEPPTEFPFVLAILDAYGVSERTSLCLSLAASVASPYLGNLTVMDVSGCSKLSSESVVSAVRAFTKLTDLNISGCELLGREVLDAIAQSLPDLKIFEMMQLKLLTDQDIADFVTSLPINRTYAGGAAQPSAFGFETTEKRLADMARKHDVQGPSLQALNVANTAAADGTCQALADHALGLANLCLCGCYKVTASGLFSLCLPRSRLRAINLGGCYKVQDDHIRHAFSNLPELRTYIHPPGFRKFVGELKI